MYQVWMKEKVKNECHKCNKLGVVIIYEKLLCAKCAFDEQVLNDKSDRRVKRYNDDLYTSGGYRPGNNYRAFMHNED